MSKEILAINEHTKFKQITNMQVFADYYNTGSGEIDREMWPVKAIEALLVKTVSVGGTKDNPPVIVIVVSEDEQKIKSKKRVKIDNLSAKAAKVLSQENSWLRTASKKEFIKKMGLPKNTSKSDIGMMKILLNKELRTTAVMSAGKTLIDNIDLVIPGNVIKKGIKDVIEMAHDNIGAGADNIEIEYNCTGVTNCHVKGVYVNEN